MKDLDLKNTKEAKNGRVKIVRWVVICAILASTGIMAALYRTRVVEATSTFFAPQNLEPVPTMVAKRTPFTLKLPAIGEIIGLETVPVPTPRVQDGSLKVAWLIPEGSFVKEGDVLVRFDSTEAQLNLETQETTLASTGKQINLQEEKSRTDSVVLDIDKRDAESEYDFAVNSMPQDKDIFSKWEIIEAQINAGLAKEKMTFISSKQKVSRRTARSDMQILTIDKNKSLNEIDIAKTTLNSMELKAPKAGLALYRRDMRRDPQVGDQTFPGQVLVELVDLSSLQARIWILEVDAAGLNKGLPVEVLMDALPGRIFDGTVRQVAALAQPLEQNSPLKYFECQVLIKTQLEDLKKVRPGMSLKAEVITNKYDSVFIVPNSSVETKDGRSTLYVKKGKDFEAREVKIGSRNHGQTAVLEGLKENDVLAMRNPFEARKVTLPDFSKVGMQQGMTGGPRVMMRMH